MTPRFEQRVADSRVLIRFESFPHRVVEHGQAFNLFESGG